MARREWKTSVNDYIVKALALALQRVPDANVTFTPDAMLKHKASDIGVAVAIPGGLITPIVRNAQAKSVHEISDEIRELAGRARERKLKPHEYEGGVSAVSNLGMYGMRSFSAVINPPQSTILAVGKGEPRMVVKNGAPGRGDDDERDALLRSPRCRRRARRAIAGGVQGAHRTAHGPVRVIIESTLTCPRVRPCAQARHAH